MKYTDNEICTLLLCSYIGIPSGSDMKPLTTGEWSRFVDVLIEKKLEPSIVYRENLDTLKEAGYDDEFIERLKRLSDRGTSLAFDMDEYEKRGIRAVTCISKNYPVLLRRILKKKQPPVLFYAGDITLSGKMGIGVVGSRNISEDGIYFTTRLAEKAVQENLLIYSGGAKGVDTISVNTSFEYGGAAVSYIADALKDRIKQKDTAAAVSDGKLLLFSDAKPDAGFSAARAMCRNKYIYASSMGTFVVESDYKKGGTWAGASEAIKNQWGTTLIRNCLTEGNCRLIEAGGIPYTLSDTGLLETIHAANSCKTKTEQPQNKETYTQMSLTDYLIPEEKQQV